MMKSLLVMIATVLVFFLWQARGEAEQKQLVEQLVLHQKSGQTAVFQLEMALTPVDRERGLMFRHTLPQNGGMLFDFETSIYPVMWMKNTYLPLDMLFLDRAGQIVHIIKETTPESLEHLVCPVPARYVVELNAGQVATHHIEKGDVFVHGMFESLDKATDKKVEPLL